MPRLVILICLYIVFSLNHESKAQKNNSKEFEQYKVFNSLEEALKQPDSVFRLNLSKKRLKKFPEEICRFYNLKELVLRRNKIAEIPSCIGLLKNLVSLDMGKNKLIYLPKTIGSLKKLKYFDLSQNYINQLPPEIGDLEMLEEFQLWQNEIIILPFEISKLCNLRFLDMRLIYMNDRRKDAIVKLLPHTEIYFSHSCNCNSKD